MEHTLSNYDFTKIPFDKLTRVGMRSMLYSDMFTVSWLLGRFCNYHCSYCWAHGRSDTKDHRATELCLATIDKIRYKNFANSHKEMAELIGFVHGTS